LIRCIEVALAIPDNEARTALATLRRLGVELAALERADLYRCDVAEADAERLVETLRTCETVYNPNKHVLRVRADGRPGPGEVWIDEIGGGNPPPAGGPVSIAGRPLAGVRTLERFTAWRLFTGPEAPAGPALVSTATETLLCNPAFQKATL
jgi:phosphoribosylformylglycinamidine (FGAM) synthase PurS component